MGSSSGFPFPPTPPKDTTPDTVPENNNVNNSGYSNSEEQQRHLTQQQQQSKPREGTSLVNSSLAYDIYEQYNSFHHEKSRHGNPGVSKGTNNSSSTLVPTGTSCSNRKNRSSAGKFLFFIYFFIIFLR